MVVNVFACEFQTNGIDIECVVRVCVNQELSVTWAPSSPAANTIPTREEAINERILMALSLSDNLVNDCSQLHKGCAFLHRPSNDRFGNVKL